MSTQCDQNSCHTTHDAQEDCCAGEQQNCCPIEKAVCLWSGSFFTAMREVQVDILKEKIKKNWGEVMEKEAEAVTEAMGTTWHSMLAQAKAQGKLREDLKSIFCSLLEKK